MIVIQVFSIGHSNASSARVTFWYTYNSNIKLVFIKYTWKTDEGWSQLIVKTLIHLPFRRLELMLPMDFELELLYWKKWVTQSVWITSLLNLTVCLWNLLILLLLFKLYVKCMPFLPQNVPLLPWNIHIYTLTCHFP